VVDPHPFARPVDPVDLPEDELEERPEAGDNDAPEQATRVR
jgi:hypothetical protein